MSKKISKTSKSEKKRTENLKAARIKILRKRLLTVSVIVCVLLVVINFIVKKNTDNLYTVSDESTGSESIVEIRERMFIGQVNDVYINKNDYLGKTIKYEGIFMGDQYDEDEKFFYYVFRYGPGGCCGIDGKVGFEVNWPAENSAQYPADDSWVEVTGVLKEYEQLSVKYLYLELLSLNVLNRRGTEFVKQ